MTRSPTQTLGPGRSALIFLCAAGLANALWALFLWRELIVARGGGEAFCALGSAASCTRVWDSALASGVHDFTGMPVAAWGVVWGLVAAALPGAMLRARGAGSRLLLAALAVTAAGGLAGVVALAAGSLGIGTVCGNCAVTYLGVGIYSVVALGTTRGLRAPDLARGGAAAAALTALSYALLLYPGLETPRAARPAELPQSAPVLATSAEQALARFVADLSESERRAFGQALDEYRRAPQVPVRTPRALYYSPSGAVRVTDFTDTLCGHCAHFHEVTEQLSRALPPGWFSLEERHFPLDAACNPGGPERPDDLRCDLARARICLSATPHGLEYSSRLFAVQEQLDREQLFALAADFLPRDALEACLADPSTDAKLAEDIAWALEHNARGTPMVLVNGRVAPASGGFLYALILAGGDPSHPLLAELSANGAR